MQETWKDIKGYKGRYQISNNGNVRSLNYNNTKKPHLLAKTLTADGYYRVGLSKNKKQKLFFVHRLVAETFISNPNNFLIINHKDGNKLNNKVNNLEYCTQSYNIKEAYRLKLMKPRKLKVNQYDLQGNFIKQWNSIKEIELFYNCRHISNCCKKKRKTAKGFIWEYAD
jgi:hypothetical protein